MTTSVRILLSHDFTASTDPPLDMLSMLVLHLASLVILDKCNVTIFLMVIFRIGYITLKTRLVM